MTFSLKCHDFSYFYNNWVSLSWYIFVQINVTKQSITFEFIHVGIYNLVTYKRGSLKVTTERVPKNYFLDFLIF